MKKKLLFIIILFVGISFYTIIKAQTHIGRITLEITAGPISISGSGSINIGSIVSNSNTGYVTGILSNNTFTMEDLRGGQGYYTTIQFDNLKKGNDLISNQNIKFKTINDPNTIHGNDNIFMRFGNGIKNILRDVSGPMTYFVRIPHVSTGSIGEFGDNPTIQITVPANTTGGTYRGTAYYTLYDIE